MELANNRRSWFKIQLDPQLRCRSRHRRRHSFKLLEDARQRVSKLVDREALPETHPGPVVERQVLPFIGSPEVPALGTENGCVRADDVGTSLKTDG